MKKVFDQTVRDLKREVNKKVLKVPDIEQKILDATSNESWGPHGTLLADIAQASRNYHEYQIIMTIIWKRINDTGKNWRHVYKALIVLDYLVAHGSERVIDDIKEHVYQISTLSDFQYIDSSGRDQGSNVRRKSQSVVALVNDKERIQEVRQKAAANRDKYRSTATYSGSRSSYSGGYGGAYDDRYEGKYGGRYEDRSGSGRDREWGYRDDDRYGGNADSRNRDGDRYSRDNTDRYGRDNEREDEYRGFQSNLESPDGSRNGNIRREPDRSYEDEDNMSSRGRGSNAGASQDGGGEKLPNQKIVDGPMQDERGLEHKLSNQQDVAPPSYEEVVNHGNVSEEINGGEFSVAATKASSPQAPGFSSASGQVDTTENAVAVASSPKQVEFGGFDEFDPRGSFSASSQVTNSLEMDLFGSDPINSLALVSVPAYTASEVDLTSNPGIETAAFGQHPGNPFGDPPFMAVSENNAPTQHSIAQNFNTSEPNGSAGIGSAPLPVASFDFADALGGLTFDPNNSFGQQETFGSAPSSTPETLDVAANFNSAAVHPPHVVSSALSGQETNFAPTESSGFPAHTSQVAAPNVEAHDLGFMQPAPGGVVPSTPASLSGLEEFPNPQAASVTYAPLQGAQGAPIATQQPFQAPYHQQPGVPSFSSQPAQVAQGASLASDPPSQAAYYQPFGVAFNTQPAQAAQGVSLASHPSSQASYNQQPGISSFNPQPAQPVSISTPAPQPFIATQPVNTGNQLQRGLSAPLPADVLPSGTMLQSVKSQPEKVFETKSTVWADTLSRGLVNLNISGPKANPHADIGVDFDSINRKEKREDKRMVAAAPVVSTVTMGRAMGAGSGIGRAGAGVLAHPSNPMGMGMGIGNTGRGTGTPMGIGGGTNQPVGLGGGYGGSMNPAAGMRMGMGMGSGMNAGFGGMNPPGALGPGMPMQPPTGMPGYGYNQMGAGYRPQQPYGGGYR